MEYDIWTDDDGRVIATKKNADFIHDSDAPYGYCHHAIRINGANKRDAMARYRSLKKMEK